MSRYPDAEGARGPRGHILQRAPTLTKDLLDRMQNTQIKKTVICGYEYKTKQLWMLAGLFFLFLISAAGTTLMWLTNAFDSFVLSNMVISNGSFAYDLWVKPPAKLLVKVHLFNYTNVDEFEHGLAKKLHVQELGPYVYQETKERINVEFNDDGTVSYQEKLMHKFMPHLSKGKQSDRIVAPNILVLSTAQRTEDSSMFTRMAASLTLGGVMNKKPFMKVAADRYIWGYDDSAYLLAKGILAFQNPYLIRERVGLMSLRNGTSPDVYKVNTGLNGMDSVGYIHSVNDATMMNRWSTEECDRIDGSDGLVFPPLVVREKKDIEIYLPEMCRKFPMVFQEELKIINNTVPAYRYVLSQDVFAKAEQNNENQCYCDINTGSCPPHGFVDASACAAGAPLFMSFPHMNNVDSDYIKVTGLNPKPEHTFSYIDIHPAYGFPMGGEVQLQMNVRVKKVPGFFATDLFDEDEIMLPVGWFSAGLKDNDLPSDALSLIYLTSFTVRGLEQTAKYGFLLTMIFTSLVITIIVKFQWATHRQKLNRISSDMDPFA